MQGTKQQVQFVQVSQTQNQLPTQSIVRLTAPVANNQPQPSFVRLLPSGQIVQLSQAQGSPQTSTAQQSNQVSLVQVQGLPGEQIAYIPMSAGMKPMTNLVQIQSPNKGNIIQVVASPNRPAAPAGRVVVQNRPQNIVLQQQARPQMVQMQVPRAISPQVRSPVRPVAPQNQRPQTSVVQVYASPRMQTTQVSRPQYVQVRTPLQGTNGKSTGMVTLSPSAQQQVALSQQQTAISQQQVVVSQQQVAGPSVVSQPVMRQVITAQVPSPQKPSMVSQAAASPPVQRPSILVSQASGSPVPRPQAPQTTQRPQLVSQAPSQRPVLVPQLQGIRPVMNQKGVVTLSSSAQSGVRVASGAPRPVVRVQGPSGQYVNAVRPMTADGIGSQLLQITTPSGKTQVVQVMPYFH